MISKPAGASDRNEHMHPNAGLKRIPRNLHKKNKTKQENYPEKGFLCFPRGEQFLDSIIVKETIHHQRGKSHLYNYRLVLKQIPPYTLAPLGGHVTSVGLASPLSYQQLQLNSAIRRFFFLVQKTQTAKHSQMTLSFRSPGTWKTLFHKAGMRANPTVGSTELGCLQSSCMLRCLCQR